VRGRQQPVRGRCDANCKPEAGYSCKQTPLGDSIQVPITYRDFVNAHTRHRARRDRPGKIDPGLVGTTLDADGKPTYVGSGARRGRLDHQRHDLQGLVPRRQRVNHTTSSRLTLWNNGKAPT
jgi:hypothetical protein